MPKRKDDLLKKQKRLIATRLMQISLLVDDYLYQQKPMSVKSALAYIKEISGYKDRCLQDVRSLQVIEKLTRCMKGIIHEQQEISECLEDVFVSSQHTPESTNCLSPVYSTVDDDLTQCPDIDEDITEIQENENNNNYVEINTSNDVTKETDPFGATTMEKSERITESSDITQAYPQNTDLEVIDLCDHDKLVDSISTNQITIIEPEFNIQNAISNLSMRDIEEALTQFSQDCSQSILNDVPLTLDYENILTSTIHHKPATENINDKITNIILPKKIAKDQKIIANEITAIQNNIAEEPQRTKALKPLSKKRNAKNNDNSKADKTKTHNKPPETVKQAQGKKTKTKQLKPTVQSHAQIPNQNHNEHKVPLTYSKQLVNPGSKTQLSKDLPIYSRMIVNDLSWIENLRFVREIPTEEYEKFTENDTFWENYTLPNNWNENDFNY